MKRLAYRSSRFLSARKKKGKCSKMIHTEEITPLLIPEQQPNRCCFGLFRVYGSDGVWAWIVAFANFLINVIMVGLERISGILYVDFMNLFNIDRHTASIPFSIQQGGRNLFGPVAGILGQKYGLRFITIIGGCIGSLCSAVLYFKMDITYMTIFWGYLFGFGLALTTTLNQLSVDQYFERQRTTAGGFAISGGCIGAIFFPLIYSALFDEYGINGTFLVISALTLNVVPAALILSEPPWKKVKLNDRTKSHDSKTYGSHNVEQHPLNVNVKNKFKNSLVESPGGLDFTILQKNRNIVIQLLTLKLPEQSAPSILNQEEEERFGNICLFTELESAYFQLTNPGMVHSADSSVDSVTESDINASNLKEGYNSENSNEINKKETYNDEVYEETPQRIYFRRKLQNLHEAMGIHLVSHFPYSDQARVWKVLIELKKLHEILTESVLQPECIASSSRPMHLIKIKKTKSLLSKRKHSNSFLTHIKTAAKLHCNILFLLVCICRGVFMMSFVPVLTIIVDFAMDKGLPRSDDTLIIVILSLGDLLGRLCLGWITDYGFLDLPRFMLIGMVAAGVSTASLPFMCSRLTILGSILAFGALQGSLYVRHPILISLYMERHEQAIGMGFMNLLSGFLGFAHPAFIGYFRDTLGSYDKMFYLNGCLCIVVGLVWAFEPFLVRIASKKREKHRKLSVHYQSM